MMRFAVLVVALLVAAAAPSPVVRLTVSPRATVEETAIVTIRIRVEPDPANAMVVLVVDGTNYFRSSEILLHNDRPIRDIVTKELPMGHYVITAVLIRYDAGAWEAGRVVENIQIGVS
jgi:hypothetical protein